MASKPEGVQVGDSPFEQAMVGQGALQDAVAAHAPVALVAGAGHAGLPGRDAQSQQMASARARLLPLFPEVEPHPAADPIGQLGRDRVGLADTEVVDPSGKPCRAS